MSRFRLLSIFALVVGLTVVFSAAGEGDSALAARSEVICKIKIKGHGKGKKRVVSCPKGQLRGPRGGRGPRGAGGPAGPAGAPGASNGAAAGLNLNFNASLTPNKTKELTIGNFTITAASDAFGNCVPISLRANAVDSRVSVGSGVAFVTVLNNTSKALTDGNNSNMFTAVSENGASTISGIVGSATAGGICLVSGYVTGL